MKSLLCAAFAAVVLVGGSVNAGEIVSVAKPKAGTPLMFKIDGKFQTVALSNGPWNAGSTGSAEKPFIEGERYFPAGTYLRAEHLGKAHVFRWETKGPDGSPAGWYDFEGEPKTAAPKNTRVVVTTAVSGSVTVCAIDGSCAVGTSVIRNEVVSSNVVYTTYCDGQTCSQVPVLQQGVFYGSSVPSTGFVEAAPQVQRCANGQCNKGGEIITLPYNFYTK